MCILLGMSHSQKSINFYANKQAGGLWGLSKHKEISLIWNLVHCPKVKIHIWTFTVKYTPQRSIHSFIYYLNCFSLLGLQGNCTTSQQFTYTFGGNMEWQNKCINVHLRTRMRLAKEKWAWSEWHAWIQLLLLRNNSRGEMESFQHCSCPNIKITDFDVYDL